MQIYLTCFTLIALFFLASLSIILILIFNAVMNHWKVALFILVFIKSSSAAHSHFTQPYVLSVLKASFTCLGLGDRDLESVLVVGIFPYFSYCDLDVM